MGQRCDCLEKLDANFCPMCGKSYDAMAADDKDYYIHEFECEDGNGYVFVRADGKGIVTCKENEGWGWIHSLSVLESYRRQGICGQLLAKVEEYFQQRGINKFYLTCSSDWHIKCYKKYGYVVTGDREGVDKGSVKMMKQLPSETTSLSPTPSRRSLFDTIKSFIHKFIH